MNQTQSYLDVHSSHLASTQPYTSSQAGATDPIPHYSHYQQPPVLHPGPTSYGPPTTSYSHYGYANGVSSPQTTSQPVTNGLAPPMGSHILPLPPAMSSTAPSPHSYSSQYAQQPHTYDTSGQVVPPNVVPKCSATLWEDEGTLCYQVEVKGVCVARRDDNHFINGTKLLNVAGMTRGRRDGILKSEKIRHVVKIGPMHLKGVWIPFERALDFANKEKITELLYPLFCHNLKQLVSSQTPGGTIPTTMSIPPDRRRLGAPPNTRSTPVSQAPPLRHPHSMSSSIPPHISQTTAQSMPSQTSTAPRPALERAHTFPTPPTSSSSLMGITNQGSSYEWPAPNLNNSVHGHQPLTIDSGLSNARSMPTTPATTPSGSNVGSMYQSQSNYDTTKPYYAAPQPSQSHYVTQQAIPQPSMSSQGNGHISHGSTAGDAHTQEPEYAKHEYVNDTSSTAYNGNRNSYAYPPNPATSTLQGEHNQLSPHLNNSGSHQNGTVERAPSRPSGQTQWTPSSYSTSHQRTGTDSGNVYNSLSDTRGGGGPTTNGSVADPYATPPTNGSSGYTLVKSSNKRGRDDDDREQQDSHSSSQSGEPSYEFKRRKTISDPAVNGVVGASVGLQSVTTGAVPRRR